MKGIEKKRKIMIFRSWHRGTKEMDLIMGSFADANIEGFDQDQIDQYESILDNNDPDLYGWITGKEDPPANIKGDVWEKLKAHKFA